jgi:Zn-dependent peptidase ImmA (M78 family)
MSSVISTNQARYGKIVAAVQSVYEAAALDHEKLPLGIVPLRELVIAYPIRLAEIPNMTYRRVAEFLTAESGRSIIIPDNEDQPLAGFLYAVSLNSCILVKKNDPITRRRFSAAHELGHYVLHFLPQLEQISQANSSEALILSEGLSYNDDDEMANMMPSGQLTFTRGLKSHVAENLQQMEREANQFAAELLMPATVCEELAERYGNRFGSRRTVLTRRLATELLVSQEAMKWRLKELGLPKA